MVALQCYGLLLAAAGLGQTPQAGETVLIEFTAEWCGPCKMMKRTIRRLEQTGYPVRQINIDRDRDLAKRFNVTSIPCFVMLVGGKEVDREVGMTSLGRLEQMFSVAQFEPPGQESPRLFGQSPDPALGQSPDPVLGQSPDQGLGQSPDQGPATVAYPKQTTYPRNRKTETKASESVARRLSTLR